MKEEIICINDTYSEDWLKWAAKNKIQYPIKDKIYTILRVITHSNGQVGVLLNEIVNPLVDPEMVLLSGQKIEVTFHMNRFRTLVGLPLMKEEIENFVKI